MNEIEEMDYMARIVELEAYIEDRDRTIAVLKSQLSAALATIEKAAWCDKCGMLMEQCRENHD